MMSDSISDTYKLPFISQETQRRCLAADVYFLEYYYDSLKNIANRSARLHAFKKRAMEENWPSDVKERRFKRHCDNEIALLRNRRTRLSMTQFHVLTQVGQGGYGQVFLARKRDTNELCALKKMSKKALHKQNEVTHVLTERDILRASNCPWLVKLLYSFQDDVNVYLAMEYVAGGDLRTLLNSSGVLRENCARFYIAEMFLAVDSLHKLGYIHRDLKPENFLIDMEGHLKLADFGLSKGTLSRESLNYLRGKLEEAQKAQVVFLTPADRLRIHRDIRQEPRTKNEMAYSLVGSPDYMAPEILENKGYDDRVDYWSLGCILFEFLTAYAPFTARSTDDMWVNILNFKEVLRRPKYEGKDAEFNIPDIAWDFICRLISDKEHRLHTLSDVQQHPFFDGFDWSTLRETKPPFVPKLQSATDTAYFDDFNDPKDLAQYKDILDNQKSYENGETPPRSAFLGFSFRHVEPNIPADFQTIRAPVVDK